MTEPIWSISARRGNFGLDSDAVHAFLDAAQGTTYYPLFHLDIYTGLRRSELLGLRWRDVDLDPSSIHVVQVLHRLKGGRDVFLGPKTVKSCRRVDLSPAAVLALRAHKERVEAYRHAIGKPLTADDLVFALPDGTPMKPDTVTHAFTRSARKAGLQGVRLHDLRHTHATLMLKQGVHPKIVQERLSHATIAVTLDTYSHVTPSLQAAAALRFDEGLARRPVNTPIGTG